MVGGQIAWHTPLKTPLVFATFQNLQKRYPPPFNWIERYAMDRSAGWIALGDTEAAALGQRAGYRDTPTRTIPMGVDTQAFRPDPASCAAVRQRLGWTEKGPPVVGYLGRFTEAKGVQVLMDALDALAASGTQWRALFVGTGPLKPQLDAWAVRHGDRVRLCTDVTHDAVPQHLNAMDLLASPSLTTPKWREQFGRMLIEAFACGVPVIGSDSGEIPYVIGDAGVVTPEGDVATWARELGSLLESSSRRTALAASGSQRAAERYAWPVVARQYLEFFDEIAESSTISKSS
jgi:glycosyltransferase involved in cell wall biosynthesis